MHRTPHAPLIQSSIHRFSSCSLSGQFLLPDADATHEQTHTTHKTPRTHHSTPIHPHNAPARHSSIDRRRSSRRRCSSWICSRHESRFPVLLPPTPPPPAPRELEGVMAALALPLPNRALLPGVNDVDAPPPAPPPRTGVAVVVSRGVVGMVDRWGVAARIYPLLTPPPGRPL